MGIVLTRDDLLVPVQAIIKYVKYANLKHVSLVQLQGAAHGTFTLYPELLQQVVGFIEKVAHYST